MRKIWGILWFGLRGSANDDSSSSIAVANAIAATTSTAIAIDIAIPIAAFPVASTATVVAIYCYCHCYCYCCNYYYCYYCCCCCCSCLCHLHYHCKLGHLELCLANLCQIGSSWSHVGGPSWASLGPCWAIFGPSSTQHLSPAILCPACNTLCPLPSYRLCCLAPCTIHPAPFASLLSPPLYRLASSPEDLPRGSLRGSALPHAESSFWRRGKATFVMPRTSPLAFPLRVRGSSKAVHLFTCNHRGSVSFSVVLAILLHAQRR
jgi:hypothetical protein